MKKNMLACVGSVLLSALSPAFAADMPVKGAPALAPYYNWSGFYIGANAGYGFGRATTTFTLAGPILGTIPLGSTSTSPSGLIAGGQAGINWQAGALVFGLEADFQYSGQKADATIACPAVVCGLLVTVRRTDRLDWFATGRGRIGYAFDRWMLYGTGGLAYGGLKTEGTLTTVGGSVAFSQSASRLGWTIGGGLEGALWANWTWKAEYLYMDFSSMDATATIVPAIIAGGATLTRSMRFTDNIVRAGINYRF